MLAGGAPSLLPELPERARRLRREPGRSRFRPLRPRSAIVVPLRARGRVLGSLTLDTQLPYGRRYSARDLHLATDLAGRAGPRCRQRPALRARARRGGDAAAQPAARCARGRRPQLAARYLVGVDGNQVGGDWYDVLPLPDGAVGVAVGDVVGHDLRAAAAMGQLRGVLRSYAWDGGGPGSVLDRCDQLVQGLDMAAMATAVYARIEPRAADGSRLIRYANAGHPAPLVLPRDGELLRLDEQRSPMIGAVRDMGRARRATPRPRSAVRRAACLLLYTDGFTDIAGEDADERTDLLERTVAALPPGVSAEEAVERVVAVCLPAELRDDVALLVVGSTAPIEPATHGLLSTVRRSATIGTRLCGAQPVHCDRVPTAVHSVEGWRR